jgi:single-strand DNA-binding protein
MEAVLRGRLGLDPRQRQAGEQTVAALRVAEHQLSKERERGDTVLWVDVEIWGDLAERCVSTLHKGDAVLVHGRWAAKEWTGQDGKPRYNTYVKAWAVAADLAPNVTVNITKQRRQGPETGPSPTELESDPFDES